MVKLVIVKVKRQVAVKGRNDMPGRLTPKKTPKKTEGQKRASSTVKKLKKTAGKNVGLSLEEKRKRVATRKAALKRVTKGNRRK